MLKIFNELGPFFKDNYRRIGVREYGRMKHVSAPTASTVLGGYEKEGLLRVETDRRYKLYSANRDNPAFVQLQRSYYLAKFNESGLIDYLRETLHEPVVVLFGSFAKGEIGEKSDLDLAIFTVSKKEINTEKFGKFFGRKTQVFRFKDREEAAEKNPELLNNILNGLILSGGW